MTEIILPTGRFARIRRMMAIDLLMGLQKEFLHASLVASVVTIDDEQLSYSEVLQMDIAEFIPILDEIAKHLPGFRKDTK